MGIIFDNVIIDGTIKTGQDFGFNPIGNPTNWNPADKGSDVILSNNDLTAFLGTGLNTGRHVRSVASVTTGKYYWEYVSDNFAVHGIAGISKPTATITRHPGSNIDGWGYNQSSGFINHNGTGFNLGFDSYTDDGDIISIALDMDTGKLWFAKNGVWQGAGDPASGTNSVQDLNGAITLVTSPIHAAVGDGSSFSTPQYTANFGATAFTYPVPNGFTGGFGN